MGLLERFLRKHPREATILAAMLLSTGCNLSRIPSTDIPHNGSETPTPTLTLPPTSTLEASVATATETPTTTATPAPTETPRPTLTPTPEAQSLSELPFFDGIQNGQEDESHVLDNSDQPVRELSDLGQWLQNMQEADARFAEELREQVPWYSIFADALPGYTAETAGSSPVHLGLWNQNVEKTDFESLRMHYEGITADQLTAASNAITQNLVQVEYNGQTRWAFTAPLDQLDTSGAFIDSPDGLQRAFAFTNDIEANQMAMTLAYVESLRQAEVENNQDIPENTIFSSAFQITHNTLAREGWQQEGGFLPALMLNAEGEVVELPFALMNEPIRTARVQQNPVASNERADQEPGLICVRLLDPTKTDREDALAIYGTEMDSRSNHGFFLVIDQEAVNEAGGGVAAVQNEIRPLIVNFITDEERGYEGIPESFEVSGSIIVNNTDEDPYGVNLYDNCGVGAPGVVPQATRTPSAPYPTGTPGFEVTPTPTPEFEVTPTPPGSTPTVTPLPTNVPPPTRNPEVPTDWAPTLVPTVTNTPAAPETPIVIPPTPVAPQPTSVFGE